jgi:hypothetical protein
MQLQDGDGFVAVHGPDARIFAAPGGLQPRSASSLSSDAGARFTDSPQPQDPA